jgi:hypothetical protein
MHLSPRCGAATRAKTPSQPPAMANGRRRMHGGKSPGAPIKNSNALKHGHYTAQAVADRKEVAPLAIRIFLLNICDVDLALSHFHETISIIFNPWCTGGLGYHQHIAMIAQKVSELTFTVRWSENASES